MTRAQITADVDRGLYLFAKIEQYKDELKKLTERLEAAALEGEQVPLEDEQREGMQFIAEGTSAKVPIVITADSIMQSFADGSPAHARIEAASSGKLEEFYKKTTTWKLMAKDGKAFRIEAGALLDSKAPEFISTCVSRDKFGVAKNAIKIEWDRAKLA